MSETLRRPDQLAAVALQQVALHEDVGEDSAVRIGVAHPEIAVLVLDPDQPVADSVVDVRDDLHRPDWFMAWQASAALSLLSGAICG